MVIDLNKSVTNLVEINKRISVGQKVFFWPNLEGFEFDCKS